MAHVKNVWVHAIHLRNVGYKVGYYWDTKTFTTFTDDNGNKTYLIDNEVGSMDEGNGQYLKMKNSNKEWRKTDECKQFLKRTKTAIEETFHQEVEEYDITYEEIIKKLEGCIDEYVEFIDNYEQYRSACRANDEIRERIEKVKKLMEERKVG